MSNGARGRRRTRPPRTRPLQTVGRVALVVVVSAVLVPVVAVIARSVASSGALGGVEGSPWPRVLGSARTWRVLGVTVAQAAASAVVSVVVGVPVAYVLSRFEFMGRSIVRTIATVPFVLPSVVIGAAFAALFSSRGLFEARGSWWLVVAAHLCFNLAVVVRVVGAAFDRVPPDVEEAARMLGRSMPRTFTTVLLPAVAPTVMAAGVIVFLFCLTSFGVIVMLGGGSVTTLEVEIWVRATRQFDLGGAAVLSAVQFVAVVATLGFDVALRRRLPALSTSSDTHARPPRRLADRVLVAVASIAVLVVCGLPLAALLLRSLQVPGGFGLTNWTDMGSVLGGTSIDVSPMEAVANSLWAALAATAVALPLGIVCGYSIGHNRGRWAEALILLPLGVSATTIGLGLLIAFGSPPLDLRGSGWLVPIAQVLVAFPLATRALIPAVRSLAASTWDAASVLGATPRSCLWRVDLPQLLPAIVAAGGLALVACLGEFGATVFVTRSQRTTMPVMVERLMARPGGAGYGQAMALSVVMVVVCGLALAVADRVASRGNAELIPM